MSRGSNRITGGLRSKGSPLVKYIIYFICYKHTHEFYALL